MSPVLERARQSWIELTSHIPHVLVMRRQYPIVTMTEGEESCLGVVDFCAESIARARRAESEGGAACKAPVEAPRAWRSGGVDETQ